MARVNGTGSFHERVLDREFAVRRIVCAERLLALLARLFDILVRLDGWM